MPGEWHPPELTDNYLLLMIKKLYPCLLLLLHLFACADDDSPVVDNTVPDPANGADAVAAYHQQAVGASVADLLTAGSFSSLRVEIVYVEGYEPTAGTINNLKAFLQQRLNKPQGITIHKNAIASPGLAPYSIVDIQQVEKNSRTLYNQDNSLAVFVFVADGAYAENENVLGVAYRNTSVALFGTKVDQYSGGIGQPSETLLETTVMNHEFGHIMGLVNVGTPPQTDHQDTAHGKHCDVKSCLMYWTAETGDVVANLAGLSQAPGLDAQCIADLQAKGGK